MNLQQGALEKLNQDPDNDAERLIYADYVGDHFGDAMANIYRLEAWAHGAETQEKREEAAKEYIRFATPALAQAGINGSLAYVDGCIRLHTTAQTFIDHGAAITQQFGIRSLSL